MYTLPTPQVLVLAPVDRDRELYRPLSITNLYLVGLPLLPVPLLLPPNTERRL